MSNDKENLSTLPIWTRIPSLDFMYLGECSMRKIVEMLRV